MEHYEAIIIGTGEIGRPLYELLNGSYNTLPVDMIHYPGNTKLSATCDWLHICIPGEVKDFNSVIVDLVIKYKPVVTMIHSTVVPGTTEAINKQLLDEGNRTPVIFTPVHGKHQNNQMKKDMLYYPKYVGLYGKIDKEMVCAHLEKIGFADIRFMTSTTAAEWSKLLSTTVFGLQVAFAQEVERVCDKFELDYNEVTDFFPIQADVRGAMYPGFIGGHCVMPNIKIIKQLHESELLDWVEWSNETKKDRDDVEIDKRER